MARITYIPAIDGLRTLAIVPVILFHLGLQWIPGGFAGVDVFFVISGYLITSIILSEVRDNTFSFLQFWKRRVQRILPALMAMVLATLATGYTLRYGYDVQDLGLQGLTALTSLANIYLWSSAGDYWGSTAEHALLLHTWSLSVEEQFYLFFPPLIFALQRQTPQRLLYGMGALVLISLGLYFSRAHEHATETFYLLHTRIWELGVGSLLAMWFFLHPHWQPKRTHRGFAIVGLLAILFAYGWLNDKRVAEGALLLPVIGTALIILDQQCRDSWLNRWLASVTMVKVGQLSYSLYLWHWPIIVLAEEQFPDAVVWQRCLAVLVLTVALAVWSYRFIEKPMRHHPRALPWIGVAALIVFALAAAMSRTGKYFDVSAYAPTVWRGPLYDVAPIPVEASERWRREGLDVAQTRHFNAEAHARAGIARAYGDGKPDIVVIGDSLALAVAGQVDDIAREHKQDVVFFTARGTPIFPATKQENITATRFFTAAQKTAFDRERRERLAQWKPRVVVITGRWMALAQPNEQAQAREFIATLTAAGSRIILLEQPPELLTGDTTTVQYLAHAGIAPEDAQTTALPEYRTPFHDTGQAFIRALANDCAACTYVATRDLFLTSDGRIRVIDDHSVLYRDDDHLSDAGAQRLRPRLQSAIVTEISR